MKTSRQRMFVQWLHVCDYLYVCNQVLARALQDLSGSTMQPLELMTGDPVCYILALMEPFICACNLPLLFLMWLLCMFLPMVLSVVGLASCLLPTKLIHYMELCTTIWSFVQCMSFVQYMYFPSGYAWSGLGDIWWNTLYAWSRLDTVLVWCMCVCTYV